MKKSLYRKPATLENTFFDDVAIEVGDENRYITAIVNVEATYQPEERENGIMQGYWELVQSHVIGFTVEDDNGGTVTFISDEHLLEADQLNIDTEVQETYLNLL